ncbi:hypothetical protein K1719_033344 [Acacia pycnantha]|nr:hypothetical protein K1719_033344 [Acacia pycnantha]
MENGTPISPQEIITSILDLDSAQSLMITRFVGGFPCNGAIFWIGQKEDVDLIVSFDIVKEVFTLTPFPPKTPRQGCYNTLACYENKLAIFFPAEIENSESYVIDLWVLEECADPSNERWSWAKIYTSRPNPYRFIICPEIIWRNEIVLSATPPEYQIEGEEENYQIEGEEENYQIEGEEENYEGNVVLCNLTTDEFNLFDIPQYNFSLGILDYVESLSQSPTLVNQNGQCVEGRAAAEFWDLPDWDKMGICEALRSEPPERNRPEVEAGGRF